jgi:hypothetical protein
MTVAQDQAVGSIADTAARHVAGSSGALGMPAQVAELHGRTLTALDRLARLQAATAQLAGDATDGACSAGCVCAQALAALASSPVVPQPGVGLVLAPATGLGPAIACTIEGGIEAMQARVGDWQDVVGRAIDRRPVPGGVTLLYDHGERVAAEFARLAAAEYACCSFFTFTLSIGPTGMAFTVLAPEEARDVVTAMFGAYGPALEEAR